MAWGRMPEPLAAAEDAWVAADFPVDDAVRDALIGVALAALAVAG